MSSTQMVKLGEDFFNRQEFDKAKIAFEKASELDPNKTDTWVYLGIIYRKLNEREKAIVANTNVLILSPNCLPALTHLGNLYLDTREFEQAEYYYERALKIEPNYVNAVFNRAHLYRDMKNYLKAIELYLRVMQLDPKHLDAKFNVSLCYLMLGDYALGWEHYQCRWERAETRPKAPRLPFAFWKGEDLTHKTIVIVGEQGFGDVLQFSRYLSMLKTEKHAEKLYVFCRKELVSLIKTIPEVDFCTDEACDIPRPDYNLLLLDLPLHFKTRVETIPQIVPYLFPTKKELPWQKDPNKFSIAFFYSGSLTNAHRFRSCDITNFESLFAIPNIEWICVQKDVSSDVKNGYLDVIFLDEYLIDFSVTANVLQNVDLIITIDTALAHLAGALGLPAWILLADPADWRWMQDRRDAIWYPSLTLFRQETHGEWGSVFMRIAERLKSMHAHKKIIEPF